MMLRRIFKRGLSGNFSPCHGHAMVVVNLLFFLSYLKCSQKIEVVVIAGPNCRTRSVLRHYPRAPRQVRAWKGEEHRLADLTPAEKTQVEEDDILLWRSIFLWMISTYLRRARQVRKEVGFLLEQPATPKSYMPQCVSFWDTEGRIKEGRRAGRNQSMNEPTNG